MQSSVMTVVSTHFIQTNYFRTFALEYLAIEPKPFQSVLIRKNNYATPTISINRFSSNNQKRT